MSSLAIALPILILPIPVPCKVEAGKQKTL